MKVALVLSILLVMLQLANSATRAKSAGKKSKQAKLTPANYNSVKKGSSMINKQIVGGELAVRGQFPFQVAIIIDDKSICGGTLIRTNWVLTAAHCTYERTNFSITLGTVDRWNLPATDVYVLFTTDKYEHPAYNPVTYVNDMCLIKLPQHVALSQYIQTIQLPPASNNTYENELATISGFGRLNDNSTSQSKLSFTQVTVISNTQCAVKFGTTVIQPSTICTLQDGKSTCQGDSGGPLAIKDGSGNWTQIGVTSFGSGNGCLDGPSGFARISAFLSWIYTTIDEVSTTTEPSTGSTSTNTTTPPASNATSSTASCATSSTNTTGSTSAANSTSPPSNSSSPPSNSTSPPSNSTSPPSNSTSPPSNSTSPPSNSTSPPSNSTSPATNSTSTGATSPSSNATGSTASNSTATGSTRATPTSTTTKPCTKKTHHPKCATTLFCLMHTTCCKVPRKDLFAVDLRNRSCPNQHAKPFNSYTLNLLQNALANYTVNFSATNVQTTLFKDAGFVDCYMRNNQMIIGGAFQANALQAFVTKRNPTDPWKKHLSDALSTCLQSSQVNSAPDFKFQKQVSSSKALVLMQCTLMKSLDLCERNTKPGCAPYWQEFDRCKSQVFP